MHDEQYAYTCQIAHSRYQVHAVHYSKRCVYHAMLQKGGMEGLQNSFMAPETASMPANTCECTAHLAL